MHRTIRFSDPHPWLLSVCVLGALACAGGAAAEGPCIADSDCEVGQICAAETCRAVDCPDVWEPVCGGDGVTYSNACQARLAHVEIASEGACEPACGGPESLGCQPGELCDLSPGRCGEPGLPGVCRPRPEVCTADWQPVCGCDGQTYGNDCMRLAAGAQKAADGECEALAAGACRSDEDCDAEGFFCLYPEGACEGAGECAVRPEICTMDWRPVCGCDGKTYGNACNAQAAGVSVAHDGEC